jgi:hypothetical protein
MPQNPEKPKSKSIVDHIKDIMSRTPAATAISGALNKAEEAKKNQPTSYETKRKK